MFRSYSALMATTLSRQTSNEDRFNNYIAQFVQQVNLHLTSLNSQVYKKNLKTETDLKGKPDHFDNVVRPTPSDNRLWCGMYGICTFFHSAKRIPVIIGLYARNLIFH